MNIRELGVRRRVVSYYDPVPESANLLTMENVMREPVIAAAKRMGVRVDKVAVLDLRVGLLAFPDRLYTVKGELDDEGILVGLEYGQADIFMPVSTKSAFVCRVPELVGYATYVPFVLSQGARAIEQMVYQGWGIIPRRLDFPGWGEAWRVPPEVLREMHEKGIF